MAKKIMFLYIISFIGVLLITNLVARATKMSFPQSLGITHAIWHSKQEMVSLLTDRADTVILGDSTAFGGYNPAELNSHVFNFALDGASPVEGYYFLKYMIEQGKRPKNIVLTYNKYVYDGGNFWDYLLKFDLQVISRTDVEEVLALDQSNPKKVIAPYGKNYQQNSQGTVARIPYYYDIALGPLGHIKPDFKTYVDNLAMYYTVFRQYYDAQGWCCDDNLKIYNDDIWCKEKFVVSGLKSHAPIYLEKLITLANKNEINIYILGGPIPESCANLGYLMDAVIGVDTDDLKLSGIYQRIIVPDKLMSNSTHVNSEGVHFFAKKVKPFFDSIE